MANGDNSPTPRGILQSWKEIAAHFDVTIRTVQNWEEEKGLPVQRMPGLRGRVWARVEDLEQWRCRRTDLEELASVPASPPDAPAAEPRRAASRSRRLWLGLCAASVLGTLLIASYVRVKRGERRISFVRLEGDTLSAVDKHGRTSWTHTFAHPVKDPAGLTKAFPNLAPVIVDLDGDGADEVAYPVHDRSGRQTDEIHVLGSSGKLVWRYRPEFALRNAKNETYVGPWKLRAIRALPRPGGGADLLTAISHIDMFPSVLVRIGSDGRPRQTYYHAGHLNDVLVSRQGPEGRPVLYLTANANSFRTASVIALDPDRMEGASREPGDDTEHTFAGLSEARELARVLVPPTPLSLVDYMNNSVQSLKLDGDRVVVEILEVTSPTRGIVDQSPCYYQVFSPRLEYDHFRISDGLELAYRAYHSRGLLRSDDARADLERVSRGIRTLVAWR